MCCAVCDASRPGHDEAHAARQLLRRRALHGGTAAAAASIPLLSASPAAATPASPKGHGSRPLVLEPSWVLTYENGDVQLRDDHSVIVERGRIAKIVKGRVRGRENRIEMPGQLLLPGLISAHTHVALGSPTRGLVESGRSFAIPGVRTMDLDDDELDALTASKLAVLYGRLRHSLINATSPVPVRRPTVWDMIKSITVNPADGLGRTDLGRIAVGAKADLTSIDVSDFLTGGGTVAPEPLNNLLYASGLHVRNVMTEGLLQIRDGRLVVDDERRVIARGGAVARKVWAQLRAEGWFTPTPR